MLERVMKLIAVSKASLHGAENSFHLVWCWSLVFVFPNLLITFSCTLLTPSWSLCLARRVACLIEQVEQKVYLLSQTFICSDCWIVVTAVKPERSVGETVNAVIHWLSGVFLSNVKRSRWLRRRISVGGEEQALRTGPFNNQRVETSSENEWASSSPEVWPVNGSERNRCKETVCSVIHQTLMHMYDMIQTQHDHKWLVNYCPASNMCVMKSWTRNRDTLEGCVDV